MLYDQTELSFQARLTGEFHTELANFLENGDTEDIRFLSEFLKCWNHRGLDQAPAVAAVAVASGLIDEECHDLGVAADNLLTLIQFGAKCGPKSVRDLQQGAPRAGRTDRWTLFSERNRKRALDNEIDSDRLGMNDEDGPEPVDRPAAD